MNVYLKILLVTFSAVLIQHFASVFYMIQSYGNALLKHYPGDCQVVEGFSTYGSEDMALLPNGKVLITSGIKVKFDYTKSQAIGAIYVMDTNKGYASVQKLTIQGWPADAHFQPHGIHHWVHENSSVSVYVILHKPEVVARFLYDGETTLTLTKVYEHPELFRNLNSVYVVGEDNFYVTNMVHTRFGENDLWLFAEFLLYLPWANVVHVSGDMYSTAVSGLLLANGVTGDGKYIYVATKEGIQVYTTNLDNTLRKHKTIPIEIGSIDNLKIDSAGDLWVGCQPRSIEVIQYFDGFLNNKCSSTIIRVKDPSGVADVESVFVDDTSLIQASSVAIYTKKKLLIGSILDKMVVCDVNYLSGR